MRGETFASLFLLVCMVVFVFAAMAQAWTLVLLAYGVALLGLLLYSAAQAGIHAADLARWNSGVEAELTRLLAKDMPENEARTIARPRVNTLRERDRASAPHLRQHGEHVV